MDGIIIIIQDEFELLLISILSLTSDKETLCDDLPLAVEVHLCTNDNQHTPGYCQVRVSQDEGLACHALLYVTDNFLYELF